MLTMTRGQVQDLLGTLATQSAEYRDALIRSPKSTIERQLGKSLGAITVKVMIDTADTVHVVVPYVATEGQLADADLERVAGGKGNITANCAQTGAQVGNTFTQTNT